MCIKKQVRSHSVKRKACKTVEYVKVYTFSTKKNCDST